ncbi:unnamed protein product [Gemmata massiliana]|uniref:Uncharacterized protein n=1 Tax=Gemmata massiliana TaxID=1210884 RepID=A0A6P2D970_9BACT|nr:hypothetical protein [Gemmata massiliana]VTR96052.1 unnamed protein product [Gemmata massiliana]
MADIIDPRAVAFTNYVRQGSELLRSVVIFAEAMKNQWFGGLNVLIPNTTDVVKDNREGEGIAALTGQDVNAVMSILVALAPGGANNPNAQQVAKPCVRPAPLITLPSIGG